MHYEFESRVEGQRKAGFLEGTSMNKGQHSGLEQHQLAASRQGQPELIPQFVS